MFNIKRAISDGLFRFDGFYFCLDVGEWVSGLNSLDPVQIGTTLQFFPNKIERKVIICKIIQGKSAYPDNDIIDQIKRDINNLHQDLIEKIGYPPYVQGMGYNPESTIGEYILSKGNTIKLIYDDSTTFEGFLKKNSLDLTVNRVFDSNMN
jgi:hypothetical protein